MRQLPLPAIEREPTPVSTISSDPDVQMTLGQYFTPDWACEAVLERYYGDLGAGDCVLEPSCGNGAFLKAIPSEVEAIGVEIDPALARVARERSGRTVLVGDFLRAELPVNPTCAIGNPPFKSSFVSAMLDRIWELLPEEGRAGFILPAFVLQTPRAVEKLANRWEIEQEMLPRNLFPRLSHPCCFVRFTKGPRRGLVGFALYHEARAVQLLDPRYRVLLKESTGSVWEAVTRTVMANLGGTAALDRIYAEIEGRRPTTNQFWKAKVRQTLQRIGHRVGPGVWSVSAPACEAA